MKDNIDNEAKRPVRKSESGRYDGMKMPDSYMKMPEEYMKDVHDVKKIKEKKANARNKNY